MASVRTRLKRFAMRFTGLSSRGFFWGRGRPHGSWKIGNGEYSSVVVAPVQWMMKSFLEAPIVVETKQGKAWEPDETHDLVSLIENPNSYYSGDLLLRALVGSLAYTGNGYWAIIRDATKAPVELWWIPSALIEPRWPTDGGTFISHYEYSPGAGQKYRMDVKDVIHFRWDIDPENDRKGLSPLASVLREVMTDDEASRFTSALLKNMGVPGLVISPEGEAEISDAEMKAAKQALIEEFSGDNVGAPFVAGSATKVQQYGFSPEQMDLKTLRRVPEERVTAVTGVAAIVAGLGAGLDRSTFANFKEAREASYEAAIIPLQRLVSSVLRHQLLPEFTNDKKNTRVSFDITNVRVLMEDQSKLVQRKLQELGAGTITVAEYRRETGRETDKTHDVYLRNFSLLEVRAQDLGKPPVVATDPNADQNPIPPGPASEPGADPTDNTVANGNGNGSGGKNRLKARTDAQVAFVATLERDLELLTDVLEPHAASILDDMGADAAALAADAPVPKSRNGNTKAADDDEGAYVRRIIEGMNFSNYQKRMADALRSHFGLVAEHTVKSLNDGFGLNVSLPDHVARDIIGSGGTRAGLMDLEESTTDALYASLREGRAAGEGPDQLARRIRSQVPAGRFTKAGPAYRARLIARSETKFAQNTSSIAAYGQAGAKSVIASDGAGANPDEVCRARDGRTFSLEEATNETGAMHPNCTLSFAPAF